MTMTKPLGTQVDFGDRFSIPTSASAPSSPSAGDMYYNTTDNIVYNYDGSAWGAIGGKDTTDMQTDIALLGFKVAANGSLAAYGLSKQTIDAFEDTSGVDSGNSSNQIHNASKYFTGALVGSETLQTWTSSTSWTVPTGVSTAEVFVVGGGGSGGTSYGGGGGGGGIVHHTSYSLTPGNSVTVTVGSGGAGVTNGTAGNNGGDSVFDTLTAKGGGRGGGVTSGTTGAAGGCGGGARYDSSSAYGSSNQASFSGATSYGNSGGNGFERGNQGSNNRWVSGGGGGAGGPAATASDSQDGDGGSGLQSSISGSSVYYGAGGGGGSHNFEGAPNMAGEGGTGGGGNGGYASASGSNATGYGAGGGGGGSGSSGSGYQGIVYAKYTPLSYNNMTLVSNASTADSVPSYADIVMTYTNGAGTATINTDIKAYVSRDGGTTWTQATLSADGTSGGHSILVAHNIDISSQPSGTSMKYKIETLNQSASKETRIQAVSLGWA